MPKITYVDSSGKERTVEGKNGMTVMETAIKHNVPGIDADCGGACACATCHVYVDPAFADKVGKSSAMEQSMLDFAENVRETSRLSCQIKIREDLDGLKVTTPESQH
jgi:ferredoxin, 2Fe-2S